MKSNSLSFYKDYIFLFNFFPSNNMRQQLDFQNWIFWDHTMFSCCGGYFHVIPLWTGLALLFTRCCLWVVSGLGLVFICSLSYVLIFLSLKVMCSLSSCSWSIFEALFANLLRELIWLLVPLSQFWFLASLCVQQSGTLPGLFVLSSHFPVLYHILLLCFL